MPIRIKSKNSVVKDKAPLPADLEIGELALNAHQDSPAIYLKDAAGAVRKVAGDGAVGATQWTRTGTELHPKTAGDAVFTSGAVKVGGTTAAPNITLKADGSAVVKSLLVDKSVSGALGGSLVVSNDFGTAGSYVNLVGRVGTTSYGGLHVVADDGGTGTGKGCYTYLTTTTAGATTEVERLRITREGNVLIGGTLPASPNITLKADGKLLVNTSADTGNDSRIVAKNGYLEVYHASSVAGSGYGIQFSTDGGAIARPKAVIKLDQSSGSGGSLVMSTTADAATTPSERARIKPTGIVNISNAPVYADNTAAKAGGLVAGDIYRTATGQLMIAF